MKNNQDKNYWKIFTLCLGLVAILLIILSLINSTRQKEIPSEVDERIKAFAESSKFMFEGFNETVLCQNIKGTPAWVDDRGVILGYGLQNIPTDNENNMSISFVQTLLIDNKIHFFYSSKCGWCEKQIELFGKDEWERYKKSNLTHDCLEVLS